MQFQGHFGHQLQLLQNYHMPHFVNLFEKLSPEEQTFHVFQYQGIVFSGKLHISPSNHPVQDLLVVYSILLTLLLLASFLLSVFHVPENTRVTKCLYEAAYE